MHLSYFVHEKLNEQVHYMLRRHWITFLPTIFIFIVMLLVPVVVYSLIQKLFPDLLPGPIAYPVSILFGSTYGLFTLLFFYAQFIDYYLDLWIITNERVVDIEQKGLFDRTISELELENIQDVTSSVRGFWGTILHYGDAYIATASSTDTIVFKQIPNPDFVRQELIRLAELDKK
jgi:hypothetical protein